MLNNLDSITARISVFTLLFGIHESKMNVFNYSFLYAIYTQDMNEICLITHIPNYRAK